MAWVKVDDLLPEHPKVFLAADKLGPGSSGRIVAVWLEGLCWANRNWTDGFLPRATVAAFRHDRAPLRVALALADEGVRLWLPRDAGWQIHDYLVYQPARATRRVSPADLSAKRAAAGRAGGLRSAANRQANTQANVEQFAAEQASKIQAPDPGTQRSRAEDHRAAPGPPVEKSVEIFVDRPSFHVIQRVAHDVLEHDTFDDDGDFREALKTRCAQLRIAYDSETIRKVADALDHQRRRLGHA